MRILVVAVVAIVASLSTAPGAEADDATLLRVFLVDGTTVVSYGEYARVGDRVVFSMPLGGEERAPALQLVNLPAAVVDWERTARYADAARRAQYAATRGESDYALLTARMARVLNGIVQVTDAAARLEIALQARLELERWPGRHYGYRADDIRQIATMLDDIVTELRAAAGETTFELNLVAAPEAPRPRAMALLPPPDPQESIAQAIAVAGLSDVPADRLSLLSAVASALAGPLATVPPEWVRDRRRDVLEAIEAEMRTERAYGELSRRTMRSATSAAARADVGRIESLLEEVRRRDEKLGQQRPAAIDGLLAAVMSRLDAARQLRLARDRWVLRRPVFEAYERAIKDAVRDFSRNGSRLDAIRRMAGPDASALTGLAARFETAARRLGRVSPPEELEAIHALLVSASRLATSAVDVRTEAVRSGDVDVAWDASAAAAGAMMLYSRARADMDAILQLPQLR